MAPRTLSRLSALLAVVALAVGGAGHPVGAADECVVVDDFAKATIGEFPAGWKARKDEARMVYTVQAAGGQRFLRAAARGVGVQAGKEFDWNVATHPVLAWAWRPREFPRGADERAGKTNDSALAVYAVFPHTKVSVKSLKYIWSERVPRGTSIPTTRGLTQGLVVRTGTPDQDGWTEERANVAEDFRRFFQEDPPTPGGIAVLTDADDTKSSAQGDYAHFRVCRS